MPPKSRPSSRPSKQKTKKAIQEPQDEPEFLEAADELEKSGGKWRAGDAAKAARFFRGAIDVYEAGLIAYPASFDLAYNKYYCSAPSNSPNSSRDRALLQYHITEDSRIAVHFGDIVDLLRGTLVAHRQALLLDQQNADILFNTAQVLASLADAVDDEEENRPEQIKLLQESVELFTACLAGQEKEYAESQAIMQANNSAGAEPEPTSEPTAAASTADVPTSTSEPGSNSGSAGSGDWATVLEPTTPSTLLETALAQLSSLTTLAGLTAPAEPSALATLAQLAAPLLQEKIPAYIALLSTRPPTPPPIQEGASLSILSATSATFSVGASNTTRSPQENAQREARLASGNWDAALAEAQFRSGMLGADDYAGRINTAFAYVTQTPSVAPRDVDALSAFADVLITFDAAVSDPDVPQQPAVRELPRLRWAALSSAQDMLKEASETMGSKTPPIYLARGDIEVRRARLADMDGAVDKVKTLLSNAGVFYRGVVTIMAAVAHSRPEDTEASAEAIIKVGVVQFMLNRLNGVTVTATMPEGVSAKKITEVLEEMVEDGLLDGEMAEEYALMIGK